MANSSYRKRLVTGTLLATLVAGVLSACGGGEAVSDTNNKEVSAAIVSTTTHFGLFDADQGGQASSMAVSPSFHLAAVLPDAPSGEDATGLSLSAMRPPALKWIPPELRNVETRRLSLEQLHQGLVAAPNGQAPVDDFAASGSTAATYSPAQIRAAYGLPALPASYASLSAAQLAQYGAGQTIYVIAAFDDQQIVGELGAFNQLFGIPACTSKTLATAATLPLSAPSANACEFYKVYSTPSASIAASAPAWNASWSVEIAMDVQWAHAIAPLARIVLVEASDATSASMEGAIGLANKMGPGMVSMSFGGAEGSYVTGLDSYFQQAGMSYFAATGDSGEAVSWPSVSPYVVSVGATSLSYNGSGSRSEVAWSKTGGGVSAYEPAPAYQSKNVPGMQAYGHRAAADVAFNGDPNSGQYVAVIPNQTTCSFCQVSWVTAGGTSLSTPQWAGLVAIVNAMRIQSGKAALGDPHSALYTQIASSATSYASAFADITQGSDGSCAVCATTKGYDVPTGLGTPNAAQLISTLTGITVTSAPVVSGGVSISGIAGKAMTFTASVVDSNAYTMSLQNAPSGMTISSKAVVTWPNPVVGTWSVNVVATDNKTGLTGQGLYSVFVANNVAPQISSVTVSVTAGSALSFGVTVNDINPYSVSMTGAPAGMTMNTSGMVSWPKPVAGSYTVTVKALDMINGLSATGTYTVIVNSSAGPTVSFGNASVTAGSPLSFPVTVTGPNAYTLTLVGAPAGMTINSSGVVSWQSPIAGNYSVSVVAKDSKTGLIGAGNYSVSVNSVGSPAISGVGLNGKAGVPLAGSIKIADSASSVVGVGVGGAPVGMTVTASGGMNSFSVNWSAPVAGNYLLQVSATDSAGKSTSANLNLVISKQ